MKRTILFFLVAAAYAIAQPIPGRYIVEFDSEPAVAVSVARGARFAAADPGVVARKSQIRVQHDAVEQTIRGLGGVVRMRFDTLLNGMAVELTEAGAARLRQMPGVRGVYPDQVQEMHLDHAVNVHKVTDAWKTITGGQTGAGAGIKIGILDSGIDTTHPAFQGFGTAIPAGFPKASSDVEKTHTNNKVIVVRDYTGSGGLDTDGHGTGNATVVAGLLYDPKLYGIGPFSGFAPGAWLGNYRVFDDQGRSSQSWVLKAIQDAVDDGMNVINYSGGSGIRFGGDETGVYARTIDAAVAAGTLVVVSAGNAGPDLGSIASPGVVASAIAVGSNYNERIFDDGVALADLSPFQATPASNSADLASQIKGPMTDVSTIDGNGFGCTAFPADSLKGAIALVSRGGDPDPCAFDDKALNAQNAGALGVVVYDNKPNELVHMTVATATVPSIFVTQDAGAQMKQKLAGVPGASAILDFSASTPIPFPSDYISYFSATGPTPRGGLKPDLVAVGGDDFGDVITASTTQGGGPPVQNTSGTSLSAPMVTGALAALMSARPGLTAVQYRSLIIDSSTAFVTPSGAVGTPQIVGGGKLNLLQALQNNLTSDPPSVNFLTSSGTVDVSRNLVLTNVGSATDTFSIAAKALNTSGLVPAVDTASLTLAPGSPATVAVRMTGANPDAGSYHGYLEISGSKGGVVTRIPYWLGVPGTSVKGFAFLSEYDFIGARTGQQMTITFRTTDLNGLPIDAGTPEVTTMSPRARVLGVASAGDIPGTYSADIAIGRADTNGVNVFTFTVGDATRDITFFVQ